MKYIIEIEDVPFSKVRIDDNGAQNINLYRVKGFNALVFDDEGLNKLTPLDKALSSELGEAYHKGFEAGQHEATTLEYQQGLDDAWKAITKIAKMPDGERMTHFGEVWISNILNAYSLEQIFTILEKSESESDEIKVGDEVKNTLELMNNAVGYFIEPTNNEYYRVLRYVDGKIDIVAWHRENCVRTGGHSYAVERMVGVMKGEQSCSSCEYSNDPDGVRCRDCCGYNKFKPKGSED